MICRPLIIFEIAPQFVIFRGDKCHKWGVENVQGVGIPGGGQNAIRENWPWLKGGTALVRWLTGHTRRDCSGFQPFGVQP